MMKKLLCMVTAVMMTATIVCTFNPIPVDATSKIDPSGKSFELTGNGVRVEGKAMEGMFETDTTPLDSKYGTSLKITDKNDKDSSIKQPYINFHLMDKVIGDNASAYLDVTDRNVTFGFSAYVPDTWDSKRELPMIISAICIDTTGNSVTEALCEFTDEGPPKFAVKAATVTSKTIPLDTWFDVKITLDLITQKATVYVDDAFFAERSFSNTIQYLDYINLNVRRTMSTAISSKYIYLDNFLLDQTPVNIDSNATSALRVMDFNLATDDDDARITYAEGSNKISAYVYNDSDTKKNAILVVCRYIKSTNELIDISMDNTTTLESKKVTPLTTWMNVEKITEDEYVKVFVFDSFSGLSPVINVITFEPAQS